MPEKPKSQREYAEIVFALAYQDLKPVDLNGRACYRIPAKTLPDDIVMNDVLYPADSIREGYETMEGTPAPLEHPRVDGWKVSARNCEAMNRHWVGAWNANVRRVLEDNGKYRVHYDLLVDIETAKTTERGQRVLNAIEKQMPISTSTGVMTRLEYVGEEEYDWIAHDIEFDHNAILLDTKPAAGVEKGVGIWVNESNESKQHLTVRTFVVNEKEISRLTLKEPPMPEKNAPKSEPAKGSVDPVAPAIDTSNFVTKDDLTEIVTNSIKTAFAERDEKLAADEKSKLVDTLVARNLCSKESAESMKVATLKELVENSKPGKAETVNGAPAKPDSGKSEDKDPLDEHFGYQINTIAADDSTAPTKH